VSTEFHIDAAVEECDGSLYAAGEFTDGRAGLGSVTESTIREYREKGFLIVRNAFKEKKAADARRELETMARADDPDCSMVDLEFDTWRHLRGRGFAGPPAGKAQLTEAERVELDPSFRAGLVRKFMGFTRQHPPLDALAKDAELLRVVEAIVGEPVRLFQSMALLKPPGGREKPWHQDHAYFNFSLDTPVVGVWIALEEATPQNGCMHVVPRGHAAGPRIHFQRRDWQICDTDMKGETMVSLPMSAGDVLLFDGKLPHGTPPNRTAHQRWAVQYHYVPARAELVEQAVRLAAFGSEGKDVKC